MHVSLKRLHDKAQMPKLATKGSACYDLYAAQEIIIKPNKTELIPLGFAAAIPENYKMCIVMRSGMALKTGLRIPNSPAQIDEDYRGEIKVIMWNSSDEVKTIHVGDRIAQCYFDRVNPAHMTFVEMLSPPLEEHKGLGSSGQ